MTTLTKLRFILVLLIASVSAYVAVAAAAIGPLGMSDGGGFS